MGETAICRSPVETSRCSPERPCAQLQVADGERQRARGGARLYQRGWVALVEAGLEVEDRGAAGDGLQAHLGGQRNRCSIVMQDLHDHALGGGAGGFVSEYLLSGGNFESAAQAGKNGFIFGAALGLAAGARAGYKQAKAMEINPWTGKPQYAGRNNSVSQVDLTFSGKQKNHNQDTHLEGKSYLTMNEQTLLDDLNSGNYDVIGLDARNSNPIVKFNYESIGVVVGKSGSVIGNTNIATIHLNSQGQIHIVPRY